jgi:hypothetical protein
MITAVEWLLQKVNGFSWGEFRIDIPKEVIAEAKQMEKEQIIKAVDSNFEYSNSGYPTLGEQYYNQKYNKQR